MFLDGNVRKQGAGWWGMRGGSGGRGVDSSARATTPGLLIKSRSPPQPYPPPSEVCAYRPPSHPRGGSAPRGEGWVGLGSGAAKPPKPLPPPVLLAAFSAWFGGARQVVQVGVGVLLGVSKIKVVGGRVGVGTLYLPLPPPLHPGKPCRARSVHGAWVERWGRGRGRSGHRRASFYPLSLGAAPNKNGARGRGVEG